MICYLYPSLWEDEFDLYNWLSLEREFGALVLSVTISASHLHNKEMVYDVKKNVIFNVGKNLL